MAPTPTLPRLFEFLALLSDVSPPPGLPFRFVLPLVPSSVAAGSAAAFWLCRWVCRCMWLLLLLQLLLLLLLLVLEQLLVLLLLQLLLHMPQGYL